MGKCTIVIRDTDENGGVEVSHEFDPPLPVPELTDNRHGTPAEYMALFTLQYAQGEKLVNDMKTAGLIGATEDIADTTEQPTEETT